MKLLVSQKSGTTIAIELVTDCAASATTYPETMCLPANQQLSDDLESLAS